ncbi:hypothetical protein R3I94_018536 [Phoxinus phoxinus]
MENHTLCTKLMRNTHTHSFFREFLNMNILCG